MTRTSGSSGISLADLKIGLRFLKALPSFLRNPLTPEEALATLRHRLKMREADLLAILKQAVYGHPESPYRLLLKHAGCEYGDIERLVSSEGVEGALYTLFENGVYLTLDEFKGRKPLRRGSTTIALQPSHFRNPYSRFHIPASSSGSRGEGTPVMLDLDFARDNAVGLLSALKARGWTNSSMAHWGVPGSMALFRIAEWAVAGYPPERWFSRIDTSKSGIHPRYRWSNRAMVWGGRMAGVLIPTPEHVPPDEPEPIIHWISGQLKKGKSPYLHTFASSSVRLCQAALDLGIDISGCRFTMSGEPITSARMATVMGAGGKVMPLYSSSECGSIGYGCLKSTHPDQVHLSTDIHAIIQPQSTSLDHGMPPSTLLFTSLRPSAPFILLNASLGDQAIIEGSGCGCPLEGLGWRRRLHTIRSFEKLTVGGMCLLDVDVIKVLEEVMPARFGGGPSDYQLLEEEYQSRPQLRLLVHPAVGPIDPAVVADAFLSAVGRGRGIERLTAMLWREESLLWVEQRPPKATKTGKILHLCLDQSKIHSKTPRPDDQGG